MSGAPAADDLRVLHLVTDRDRRGAQVFATDLAQGLEAVGVHGSVVALEPGGNDDVLPIVAAGRSRRAPATLRAVRRLARDHDVVVAHGSTTLFVASIALAGTGVPFVYRQISDPRHWAATALRRARVALLIRRAARVVALSPEASATLRAHYRIDDDRIVVIPNAVPREAFEPAGDDARRHVRRRFGLPDDADVLVTISALVEEKGVDLAIGTCATNESAHLLVVGDGDRRADLERLAEQVAAGRVQFTGPIDRPIDALRAADVLVFPSRGGDSMPAALIEAGLCGLPVVATPVGSIGEIVTDRVTGRVVPIGDQRALDSAVAELLDDPEERRRLGNAARRHCLASFTIDVTAPRWANVLVDVARRPTDRER